MINLLEQTLRLLKLPILLTFNSPRGPLPRFLSENAVENALPIFFIFPSSVDVLPFQCLRFHTVGFSICEPRLHPFETTFQKLRFVQVEWWTGGWTFDSETKVFYRRLVLKSFFFVREQKRKEDLHEKDVIYLISC